MKRIYLFLNRFIIITVIGISLGSCGNETNEGNGILILENKSFSRNITKVEVLKNNGNVYVIKNYSNGIENDMFVEIKLPKGVYRLKLTTVTSYYNPWDGGIVYIKQSNFSISEDQITTVQFDSLSDDWRGE